MTRAEALTASKEILEGVSLEELYALHQTLDGDVTAARFAMQAIHDEITRREHGQFVPGPAHLKQSLGQGESGGHS